MAAIVAAETGKAPGDARGEVGAAIEMGYFVAGEGRRLYGRTTTSAIPNRAAMTIRQPLGVAGLIIAANTPIANVAWKVFPALLCGNGAVLKASEEARRRPPWRSAGWPPEAELPPGSSTSSRATAPTASRWSSIPASTWSASPARPRSAG